MNVYTKKITQDTQSLIYKHTSVTAYVTTQVLNNVTWRDSRGKSPILRRWDPGRQLRDANLLAVERRRVRHPEINRNISEERGC